MIFWCSAVIPVSLRGNICERQRMDWRVSTITGIQFCNGSLFTSKQMCYDMKRKRLIQICHDTIDLAEIAESTAPASNCRYHKLWSGERVNENSSIDWNIPSSAGALNSNHFSRSYCEECSLNTPSATDDLKLLKPSEPSQVITSTKLPSHWSLAS